MDDNGYTPGELRRSIDRVDRRLERHETSHISIDQFNALLDDLREMKETQRWWRRLLATQALITLGALVVLAISLIAAKA